MTPSLKKEIKLKRTLFRQYKRTKSDADRLSFNQQRNKVTKLLRRAERAYVATVHRGSRSSAPSATSTSFWEFMRALSGKAYRPFIPDLQSIEQGVLTSSQDKAEA